MINIQFNIRVPGRDRFKNIRCWHGSTLFERKFWELQIYRDSDIINLCLRITRKQDHAGIQFGLGLFGLNAEFQIYDNRHWDQENECWKTY